MPVTAPRPFRPTRAALALAASLGVTATAHGQAAPTAAAPARRPPPETSDTRHDDPRTLDSVIVTAGPLRGGADSLTRPVEVLAGSKLDAAKGATLGETVGKLPGVQSSFFGTGVGRPVIRGMDGPRVAVVSGGLGSQDVSTVSQDHAVAMEPFLADQIEVLKGPATLLYGSGAIGGLVNVVDGRIGEQPLQETVSGRAEARYDSVDDGSTGMARVDAAGADGALVLHADGVIRRLGDYRTPLGVQRNSFNDTTTAALGASWVGADGFLGATASKYDNAYGNPGEPGAPVTGDGAVRIKMTQSRLESRGAWTRELGPFSTVRFSASHADYEHVEYEGDAVGTRFLNAGTEGRLELTLKPMGRWRGAIGTQASRRAFEAIGEEAFIPATRTRNGGVFVTEQGRLGPVQLNLGARVDRVVSTPAGGVQRSFTPTSLSAAGTWSITPAWRVGVNLDRAERAPAEEELFANGPHIATSSFEIGRDTLTRERANQRELSLHYHGDRLDAKLSTYRTAFDGFIYLAETGRIEDSLPVRAWSQSDAVFRGSEGEVIGQVLRADAGTLTVRAFGDVVRARRDSGEPLPRVVPARVGGELAWRGDGLRASVDATRYRAQNTVAPRETPTAGYTLLGAHMAYHRDVDARSWEVFMDATNLTDAVARVHTSFLKDRVVLPGRGVAAGIRVFF